MPEENAVSVKLPQFWPDTPEFWFAQTEAQFNLRGIKDETTKYNYVLSAIDQSIAKRVMDFIKSPPATGKYEAFKKRLLTTFSLSDSERASKIINLPELGEEKPSVLMDSMLALLGNHEPCFLFRELFLQKIPEELRNHLVTMRISDCRQLAAAADDLHQTQPSSSFNAIRKFQRPTNQKEKEDKKGFCFFHARFGARSYRCQQPCTYKSQGNEKAGHQ